MYKNNSQFNSKIKGCSPLQLFCNLTGKCHAVGYYSYTKRYLAFKNYELQIKKYYDIRIKRCNTNLTGIT